MKTVDSVTFLKVEIKLRNTIDDITNKEKIQRTNDNVYIKCSDDTLNLSFCLKQSIYRPLLAVKLLAPSKGLNEFGFPSPKALTLKTITQRYNTSTSFTRCTKLFFALNLTVSFIWQNQKQSVNI